MRSTNLADRTETGGATAEPVTIDQVKANSNISGTQDDELIYRLIQLVTDTVEEYIGRTLIEKTATLYLDEFPGADSCPILLNFPPVISITSVKYYDDADVLQTWDSSEYELDNAPKYCGLLYPGRNYSWPSARLFRKSVIIEYQAGYESTGGGNEADRIPGPIAQAILMFVGHLYEHREATFISSLTFREAPLAVEALLGNYRVRAF